MCWLLVFLKDERSEDIVIKVVLCMAKMIIFKKSPTKILLWIMIWQNWSDVSIQINTKALQGIVRCSTSHTRKRRFMLVPGPPLLYGGFAFYNWDILMSKKTYFLLAFWQEQLFPFVKVKRQCWLSAGWPVRSAKLREVISAFIISSIPHCECFCTGRENAF